MNNLLNFKGVKDGLVLQIQENTNFSDIENAIEAKAKTGSGLIENSDLIGVIGAELSYKEKAILEELLNKLLKINVLSLENFSYNDNKDKQNDKKEDISKDYVKENTKFIETTLRSGSEIISDGHIVVLGDVNPGAILKAKGNILVMGKLRGIAHAGIEGNNDAFIAANLLMPNQIRISNIISRAPDNASDVERISPEKALISDGRIIIERL